MMKKILQNDVSVLILRLLLLYVCIFITQITIYAYNRMLLGARNMIKKFHPRMAICIYHNMIDLYSIPQVIYDIDPGYRLAVRHHSYGYEETVLYAW